MQNNLYTTLANKKFSDIYGNVATFLEDYKAVEIPQTLTETEASTLFYLLYSQYGNSTISSSDENRFKYNLFAIIFSYGPSWARKVKLQETIRNMSEDELREGSFTKVNHAYNPSTASGTEEIEEINEQNTTRFKKDKMSAYAMLDTLIETDVTQTFLNKFKKLFRSGVVLGIPLYYISDEED